MPNRSKPKAGLLALTLLLTACAKPSVPPMTVQIPQPMPALMRAPPGPFLPSAQANIVTWQERLTGSAPSS